MHERAHFAYAQARLQARHGARPDEQLWRRLASAGDLAGYLDTARRTTLRPWLTGMQAAPSSQAIELLLRQRFRHYVDEVANWLPGRWRETVHWVKRVPDLPALQHLLAGAPSLPWMPEDPALQDFASGTRDERLEALRRSDCNCLVSAWQQGTALPAAWLEQWRRLWPVERGAGAGLAFLGQLLRRYSQAMATAPGALPEHRRRLLVPGLHRAFRRHAFQPAAACAHLGLVALDLERLRGELVTRALFADIARAGL
jgi:hypothetical protein